MWGWSSFERARPREATYEARAGRKDAAARGRQGAQLVIAGSSLLLADSVGHGSRTLASVKTFSGLTTAAYLAFCWRFTEEAMAMDFLVTMTTNVPAGTPKATVEEVRARETARSLELEAGGHLLRLWRPPLQPGEWRTLGLFASDDADHLEESLASMPLRIWRTDEVTPLLSHRNDPGPAADPTPEGWAEYLTTFTTVIPSGTPAQDVTDAEAREAARAHDMAEQGHLVRLWKLGGTVALGLWRAGSADEMQQILRSLPLSAWMKVEATPLSEHPNDPARRSR
jgi:muconolactone delta-isomerase